MQRCMCSFLNTVLQHKQFRLCRGVEWSKDLGELRESCDSVSGQATVPVQPVTRL